MNKMTMTPSEYQELRRMELTRDDIISAMSRCGRMHDDWNNPNLLAALRSAHSFINAKIKRIVSDEI